EFEYILCGGVTELADSVEDPEQGNSKIALTPLAAALEAFKDGVEILLAPQADANGDINFRMEHVLRFQRFHEPVSDQLVVVGGLQIFGNGFEGHEKSDEILVLVELADFGERGGASVALAEFEQSFRLDGTFEVQVQLSLGQGRDESARTVGFGGHVLIVDFRWGNGGPPGKAIVRLKLSFRSAALRARNLLFIRRKADSSSLRSSE